MWKVLVTAPRACDAIDRYRAELGAAGCVVQAHRPVERFEEDEMLALVGDADAIVCGDDRLTARVIDAAPRLRVIAKWGTGIDAIDREAARRRQVAVCNTPDAFSEPVADSVLGYMLLFARHLDRMTDGIRAGEWRHTPLRALSDCTVGIVGLGHIGTAVARRAAACGMRILACDLEPAVERQAEDLGIHLVTLEAMLPESDFVTLHVDLRPENRYLLNRERLGMMRSSAVLINTARGPIVDESALVAALEGGRLAGAALDVFDVEPLPASSPLRLLPNVYLAPHNANSSPAAAERVHRNTIRNVLAALGTMSTS